MDLLIWKVALVQICDLFSVPAVFNPAAVINKMVSVLLKCESLVRTSDTRSLISPTHSMHTLLGDLDPPHALNVGDVCLALGHTHTHSLTHSFNFLTTASEHGLLIWAAISLRWRRRASVFNVLTQAASRSVYRLKDPALMQFTEELSLWWPCQWGKAD